MIAIFFPECYIEVQAILHKEVISKVIQKVAKLPFAKSCKESFDPASPDGCAVTRAAACKVTAACRAEALSEGTLTILRSFEIASQGKTPNR